jgi:uncharacterized LabA/DUF88 family protein
LLKPRYAILLDGGFIRKKLNDRLGHHPTADDIVNYCNNLQKLPEIKGYELLRVYYYDAEPAGEKIKKPVTKGDHNLGDTERFRQSQSLFSQLILKPSFALRMGQVNVSPNRWVMKPSVARQLVKESRPLTDDDFVIDAQQKGVDMRIGMDMARLALREMVRTMIVVTGDADFVPAFKFVRREGVKVILDLMGENGRVELKQHSDIVLGR